MAENNSLKKIIISGFRGFSAVQELQFSQPNGELGSGLTVLVGPNNAGKSSVVEAVTAVTQRENVRPTFSEGKRNVKAGSKVKITIEDNQDGSRVVETVASGGSESVFSGSGINPSIGEIFTLPSRRRFDPFFGKGESTRESHINNTQVLADTREGQTSFAGRMFYINNSPERRAAFEQVLKRLLDPLPSWTIEQSDQGRHYIKVSDNDHTHTSDGLGEGILSAFFIVDALYDSAPGSVVFIDEPELSLHPQLQAKVRELLIEYSAERQIVISTHSPKFIDWYAIAEGAQIARIVKVEGEIKIHQIREETQKKIAKLLNDLNNPHVLGLEANEVFFLFDYVLLVEGQEDVMFFPKVMKDISAQSKGEFFGWGVGGASKMETVAAILSDLGFKKVAGILDANVRERIQPLQEQFPNYYFVAQPADDVRFKSHKPDQTSLLDDENRRVREQFKNATIAMFKGIEDYFDK